MKNEIIPYPKSEFNLDDFNFETRRLDSLNYNVFLNDKFYKNTSIANVIYDLQHHLTFKRVSKLNKRITNEGSINLVINFFKQLGLKDKIEPILTCKNPMFKTLYSKNGQSSYVKYVGNDKEITFSVGDLGTYLGVNNLVHESSHAISGHYTKLSNLIKKQNKILNTYGETSEEYINHENKMIKFLTKSTEPLTDCISEIDTFIMERLFLEYATNNNLISPEDKQIVLQDNINDMRQHMLIFFQEDIIYRTIRKIKEKENNTHNEISNDEYLKLKETLSKRQFGKELISRLNFISQRNNSNKYLNNIKSKFRYIVAFIFSRVWMDKFLNSKKQEKLKMLEDFKTYLLNNHKHNLHTTLEHLLPNETYETLINKFIEIHNPKTQELEK